MCSSRNNNILFPFVKKKVEFFEKITKTEFIYKQVWSTKYWITVHTNVIYIYIYIFFFFPNKLDIKSSVLGFLFLFFIFFWLCKFSAE